MYYIITGINIKPFKTNIPEVLAVSKHLVKPFLRAQLFLFQDVDYGYREFKFTEDVPQYTKHNEFTSGLIEQQMDFEFDTANNTTYVGLAANEYEVEAIYPNKLVVYIDDEKLKDTEEDISVAIFDAVNSYLPIDFIYSRLHSK